VSYFHLFHRTKGKPTKKGIRSRVTKEGQVIDKPWIQSRQFHEMSREFAFRCRGMFLMPARSAVCDVAESVTKVTSLKAREESSQFTCCLLLAKELFFFGS
jgi:hypothetical protein